MEIAKSYWSQLMKYIPGESKSHPLSIKVRHVVLGEVMTEMVCFASFQYFVVTL